MFHMGRNVVVFLFALAGCNQRPLGPVQASSELLCQFDSAKSKRAVLASAAGNRLELIRADGSRTSVWTFGPNDAMNVFNQTVTAHGGFIAAAASWVTGDVWTQDLVLLAPDERVLWHGSSSGTVTPQLFLDASGWLAVALGNDGFLVSPEGQARQLSGLAPLAAPTDDGSVVVRGPSQGEMPGPIGWLRGNGNALEPLQQTPGDPWTTPLMIAGRATYVAQGPLLVSEKPGDARTLPLPGVDPMQSGIIDSTDSGWVLIGDWRTPLYLANVRTLESHPVGMSTPDGFRPFTGALYGPRLDSDGALLFSLRDDYAGALYRFDSDWHRIGGTVTNVLDINALAHGGTYLINATNGRYSFEEWTPAPADQKPDYDGNSLQLVRPQSNVSRELSTGTLAWTEIGSLSLSSDGRCLAYWSGNQLQAWNVESDRSFTLETSDTASQLAWIE
jgi:hypothetical protein